MSIISICSKILGRSSLIQYGVDPGSNLPWKTVAGVVSDMRRQRLDEAAIPYMFQPGVNPQMDIAIRTSGNPELLRDAIRAEMRMLDSSVPPYGIVTVEQRLALVRALCPCLSAG